jgi:hypothetical protein
LTPLADAVQRGFQVSLFRLGLFQMRTAHVASLGGRWAVRGLSVQRGSIPDPKNNDMRYGNAESGVKV